MQLSFILLVKLTAYPGEGNDGQGGNGNKGAKDKEPHDSSSHLALEECLFYFHDMRTD
jgi:hypothetical protein